MKEQTKQHWKSSLSTTIAAIILFGAFGVTFAQTKDEYPKPDFSAMAQWYEVVKWDWQIFDQRLNVVIKPKVESRPYLFEMRFEDADGVLIFETSAGSYYLNGAPSGQPLKFGIITPTEKQMEKVKKVYVVRKKQGS